MTAPDDRTARTAQDRSRSVPSLLASLFVSIMVAGMASALILGLIPPSRHAAQAYACPAGAACWSAYLVLALPGLALALATIVGATAWAIIRVRRHRRASR